jgi:hypothetical protein
VGALQFNLLNRFKASKVVGFDLTTDILVGQDTALGFGLRKAIRQMRSNRIHPFAVLAAVIITTIAARSADRPELEKLIQDPTSDLSALTSSEIDEAAQLDAELYFKRKGSRDLNEATSLGEGHALNHHLLTNSARSYSTEFASGLESLARAQADEAPTPDSKTSIDTRFFAGAHLGMSIKECSDYYKQFDGVGAMGHSGAPLGERQVDFRTSTNPQRRVYLFFREADNKIVSIMYWKLGDDETFSIAEQGYLTGLNRGHGPITTRIVEGGSGFEVTTPRQRQIEGDAY